MLLKYREGNCILSGKTTSKGGEVHYMGESNKPKLEFSVLARNFKDENGNWKKLYIDVALWGPEAEEYSIPPHTDVIVTGTYTTREYTNRSGEVISKDEVLADAIIVGVAKKEKGQKAFDPLDALDEDATIELPWE